MDCPMTEAVAGLPDDHLVEILSRAPAKSVCRFKCVSKAWRDLIADPLHRKKLPQTLEGFFFMVEKHYEAIDCDDGDGEGRGTDDSDGEEVAHYGFFDVLKGSVSLVDFIDLTDLPVIKDTRLVQCCNGLLLFAVASNWGTSLSYIVCNPATMQCVPVPSSGLEWKQMISGSTVASLLFDPSVGRHFNLVQVSVEAHQATVLVYSSETQAWSPSKSDWAGYHVALYSPGVYINGMLHLLVDKGRELMSLDLEGNIIIIHAPFQVGSEILPLSGYIGQSQGCFYYFCREFICDGSCGTEERLVIWVLQDYDRQEWVLKDSVSFSNLFGERNCLMDLDCSVVGIHPDHSLVFLVRHWDQKLITYNMDSKEVCDLCTLGQGYKDITPYVPYFSEFAA